VPIEPSSKSRGEFSAASSRELSAAFVEASGILSCKLYEASGAQDT